MKDDFEIFKDLFKKNKLDEEIINLEEDEKEKFVCFKLDEQEYGIDVSFVLEVITEFEITDVIHTPSFILGVINLRGNIVPVIDLKQFFLINDKPTKFDTLVIVKFADKVCALAIDKIEDLKELNFSEIASLPVTISGKIANYLSGLFNYKNEPVMIINIENILTSDEFKEFE